MASETVAELASVISKNTATVVQYLSNSNLPHPSFGVDAPSASSIPRDAVEIEAARQAVVEATLKLRNLMLGPREYLQSFAVYQAISVHSKFQRKILTSHPFSTTTFSACTPLVTSGSLLVSLSARKLLSPISPKLVASTSQIFAGFCAMQ